MKSKILKSMLACVFLTGLFRSQVIAKDERPRQPLGDQPVDTTGHPGIPNRHGKTSEKDKGKKKKADITDYSVEGHAVKVRFKKSGKLLKFENKHIEAKAANISSALAKVEDAEDFNNATKEKFSKWIDSGKIKRDSKVQINISYVISEKASFTLVHREIKVDGEELGEEGYASSAGLTIYDANGDVVIPESDADTTPLPSGGYLFAMNSNGGGSVLDSKKQKLVDMPYFRVNIMSENSRFLLQLEKSRCEPGSYQKFATADLETRQVKKGQALTTESNRDDAWFIGNDGVVGRRDIRFDSYNGETRTVKFE